MQTWIAKVRCPDKEQFWVGNFKADGRENAKREARRFVSTILPLEAQILSIARGSIAVQVDGPEIPVSADEQQMPQQTAPDGAAQPIA